MILCALNSKEMWAKEISEWLELNISWKVNERGLHRVLQCLHNNKLLEYTLESSPFSGAGRKIYKLTPAGKNLKKILKTQV